MHRPCLIGRECSLHIDWRSPSGPPCVQTVRKKVAHLSQIPQVLASVAAMKDTDEKLAAIRAHFEANEELAAGKLRTVRRSSRPPECRGTSR